MSFSLRIQAIVGVILLVVCNLATIGLITRARSTSLDSSHAVARNFGELKSHVIPLGTDRKSVV
jgi:hypothetical protein